MKNILKPNLDSRPKFSFFSALPKETLTATVLAFSGETPFPTTMNHQPCFIIFFINFPIPDKCSLHFPWTSHYKINSAYKKKQKISHPWFSTMLLRVGRDHNYLQAHTFLGSLIATRNGKFNCNTQWEVSDWCRDVDHLQTGGILFTIHIFSLFKNQNPKLIALTHGLSPDCVV